MRPQTLDGYVGQQQAVGDGSWLRRAIEHDTLSSVILYGPAGTGKTTLARIIANTTHAEFVEVSAISGTVKDLRREIDAAESRLLAMAFLGCALIGHPYAGLVAIATFILHFIPVIGPFFSA